MLRSNRNGVTRQSGLRIITEPDEMYGLRSEWEALWAKNEGRHNQSFLVCWLAWVHVAKPAGKRLHCIVYREAGELVLVWPLVSHRRAVWTMLEPLAPGTAEHTSILASADADLATEAAWHAATRQCGGDVFTIPYVGANTQLDSFATHHPGLVETSVDVTALAMLRQIPDWTEFCNSMPALSKRKPGALERRFVKEGDLQIRILDAGDTQAHAHWVDWMLARKREWAERAAKHGPWLESKGYRDFLINLLDGTRENALAIMLVMTLDNKPVVMNIIGTGKTCASGLIAGFDPAYSRFSPGLIMMEHCVKWAWENRVDLDFGVGKEEFKAYWSRGNVHRTKSYQIAISAWGRFAIYAKEFSKKVADLRASKARQESEDPAETAAS